MQNQNKYLVVFGHKNQPGHLEMYVYAFDTKSAIYVALESMKDEASIPAITKIELVKET